jgi:hypothetical protein
MDDELFAFDANQEFNDFRASVAGKVLDILKGDKMGAIYS